MKYKNNCINALVVEGGAMRGIFSTGILDAFLERQFNPFDLCIGVSAGATNIAAYLAEMFRRNYKIYMDYSTRPNFINWLNFAKGKHLIDLDWLWDITIKETRLDLDKILSSPSKYLIGVADVNEGKAVYLEPNKSNLEDMIKASSALPLFYRNKINIQSREVIDGGLADPIPVIEAYNRGAKNILVVRSRQYDYAMNSYNSKLKKILFKKHPELIEAITRRPEIYNKSIEFMRNPPEDVKIIEVKPPKEFKTKRLTKDSTILQSDYSIGYAIGLETIERWNVAVGK